MITSHLIHHIVAMGNSEKSTPETVRELILYLHHPDGNVRRLSCSALGKLKSKEALKSLLSMLSDTKPQVRQYALKALVTIATPSALPAISQLAENPEEKPYNLLLAKRFIKRLSGKYPISKIERFASPQTVQLPDNLSSDQKLVLQSLLTWIRNPRNKYITVGGYAGTGKTTIIAILRTLLKKQSPNLSVAFACFTGKASRVLKSKLLEQKAIFRGDSIGTLHSLMYKPRLNKNGQIIGWKRVNSIDADLVIIDEASMVTLKMWQDLCSYSVPIIAIGDHGQLPPVGDSYGLMDNPHLRLEIIHRHAKDNPILKVATLARTSGQIPFQDFSPIVRKVAQDTREAKNLVDLVFHSFDDNTLILCGRNATRVKLNQQIRNVLGFTSDEPIAGERVICLKNNYKNISRPIYNGMIGKLIKLAPYEKHWYDVSILFQQEDVPYQGKISRYQFHKERYLEEVKGIHYTEIGDRFDFGYALTVHKSQGSQAERVLLFEESSAYWEGDLWNRWLYTAVTRAIKELYIIG